MTKAAQLWLSDAPNYGIVLEQTENPEALNYFKFVSSDNTDYPVGDPYSPTASPLYQFVYRDMTGLESYWSYTTASAGRAGSVYVNNYTGEATVTAGLSSTDHTACRPLWALSITGVNTTRGCRPAWAGI